MRGNSVRRLLVFTICCVGIVSSPASTHGQAHASLQSLTPLKSQLPFQSPSRPQAPTRGTPSTPSTNARTSRTDARRWLPTPTLVHTIVGPDGDELLTPSSIVALNNGQLALFDFGAMELRAFATDGRQLWRTGRKGSGPGEFRNAMDLKVLPNGELQVLDMGSRRVTTVSSTGKLVRTIPVRFSSSRFIPLADTTLVGLTADDSGAFWSAVNRRGDVVQRGVAPPSIANHSSLTKEMFTTRLGAGAAVAFRWSDKIAILNASGGVARILDGVEPLPFPAIKSYPMKVGKFTGQVSRIDPKAVPGALSIASSGQQIFVLFAGATANRGHIIDVYDARTGGYVGSQLLPNAAQELVVLADGSLATLRAEPIPSVDVWKVPSAKVGTHPADRAPRSALQKSVAKAREQ